MYGMQSPNYNAAWFKVELHQSKISQTNLLILVSSECYFVKRLFAVKINTEKLWPSVNPGGWGGGGVVRRGKEPGCYEHHPDK